MLSTSTWCLKTNHLTEMPQYKTLRCDASMLSTLPLLNTNHLSTMPLCYPTHHDASILSTSPRCLSAIHLITKPQCSLPHSDASLISTSPRCLSAINLTAMPHIWYYLCTIKKFFQYYSLIDRLCGPVVGVPGYTSGGPGFDSWHYEMLFVAVGLKRDLPSLVRINEDLLER
jgi:hypothetical protein